LRLVTQSPALLRVIDQAERVAASPATVFIQGESGTGKELLARFIHETSGRLGPFVAVNCANLPDGLVESELFGHERGAFTGADRRQYGKFELAAGGTLLLDEISEMPLHLQAKLLRALQEGAVDRVGGRSPVAVDVRVLATTNRDLQEFVQQGRFRADLYFRLNVVPLRLPPLRDRIGDVPLLTEHFLGKWSAAYGREPRRLSADAAAVLMGRMWPGNVRELENILSRGVLLAQGPEITPEDLMVEARGSGEPAWPDMDSLEAKLPTVRESNRELLRRALLETGGCRVAAADLLDVSARTVRNWLKESDEG
jgi:two-component system response regulator FlrC